MNRPALIDKLKEDITQGRVVLIAGTGVSVAACGNQKVEGHAVATWIGLLQHGIQYCKAVGAADDKAAKLLAMQIESGEIDFLVSAAETISTRLKARSEGEFRGWLKGTLGQLKVKDRAVLEALTTLPCVFATLNYDNLIEDSTGRRAVTWLKEDDVQDVLMRRVTDAVLHLHGWFREPESVVLGLSSYLAVKDHPHAKAVLNLFTLDRTLLLVGCGDTVLDPNFTRLVEWGREALKNVVPRHYLLCRTSEVADFQKKLAGAPWLQPVDYGVDHKDLAPFLCRLLPAGGVASAKTGVSIGPGFDLEAYQRTMRKRYTRLKLEELDPTTHDIRSLTLTGMFIAQSARECAEFMPRVFELPKELQQRLRDAGEIEGAELDEETVTRHRRAYLDQSPRPIVDIISDPGLNRVVILGDPGSGKSTLLQYLLLKWAERGAPNPTNEPLPLLIELREYARLRHEGLADSFLGYLHDGENVRWHFDQAQLDQWLKDNPSLILFDGLDEIFDPTLRREISTAIHRFAGDYPRARLIVTSRIIGYQHQAWRDEDFRHFMLQELDDAQIADFLNRWHRGAYENPAQGETKRSLLTRGIADSAAIRQLAGNPLLLTMMAILNRTQDLPRDRAELYEQCARLLLHQWKVEAAFSSYPELANASLDFKDKRGLLLRVARTMQTSERGLAGNLIDGQTLEATLEAGLKDIPNLRGDRAARALIEQLRGRNFMLSYVGAHSYAFVHRTFLEYFCAVEIRERFERKHSLTLEQLKTEIFGHWMDETWHEILCLLAGTIDAHFVAEILEWLLAQPDPDRRFRHVFLAARCIGEVRERGKLGAVEKETLDRTTEVIGFDFGSGVFTAIMGITTNRRAIELVATVWHDAPDTRSRLQALANSRNYTISSTAVRALARGWKDDPKTLPWLKACAQSDENEHVRKSAVQELAGGWKDDSETLVILKARARSDEKEAVRQSALEELARGWKEESEISTMLKASVHSDEHWSVRQSAVKELAGGWKGDPETLLILQARARSDENGAVRQTAMEELARGWKDHPETLSIVQDCARSDENEYVRQSAVRELARQWSDDAKSLPILKALAQSDASEFVRRSAVEARARGWKDSPETLQWLQGLAQSDEHDSVRQSAVQELARGWKDHPETLPILKGRAQSDEHGSVRQSAVEELARGWKDHPDTLSILKTSAQSDKNEDVRRSAVQELARSWKDDPQTLLILQARAQSDENTFVRESAMRELVRGWKDHPETLSILKARAQSDEHEFVRQSAVEALARGWKDHPDTLSILKTSAQSDKNEDVRRSAVRELARGWKAHRETLPIIQARAQSDENTFVRESAMRELMRGWKDHPETLSIVRVRAQSDRSEYVRQSALNELRRIWNTDLSA